jgi:hypothetical protein
VVATVLGVVATVLGVVATVLGVVATVLGVLDVSPTVIESLFLGVAGFMVLPLVFRGIVSGLLGPDFAGVVLIVAFLGGVTFCLSVLFIGVPAVVSLRLVHIIYSSTYRLGLLGASARTPGLLGSVVGSSELPTSWAWASWAWAS